MPSPLGDKIRNRRTELKLSLDKLAEQAEASKSYLWELENKDVPKPSADKLVKLAAALKVTPEFLLATDETSPGNEVLDTAFFRKYKQLPETDKKRLQRILDAWEDED